PLLLALRFFVFFYRLDALIFADTTCEPVSNFLSLGRLAPVQAAFWGTPITSGASHTFSRSFFFPSHLLSSLFFSRSLVE
ncbi:unnamed protein product, partial [Laminaria digitata]